MISKKFPMRVALAVYSAEEYAKLLVIAEDASELDETWEEWHASMQKAKLGLAGQGIECVPVPIEMEKLTQYCLERIYPITAVHAQNMLLHCYRSGTSNSTY